MRTKIFASGVRTPFAGEYLQLLRNMLKPSRKRPAGLSTSAMQEMARQALATQVIPIIVN